MNKDSNIVAKPNFSVDGQAESAVVRLVATLFNDIAHMNPDEVRHNIELATADGFSKMDRSIRVDLANYLLKHFSYIYLGLISNQEFRDAFIEAVSIELALEEKDEEFIKQVRLEMIDGDEKYNKGFFVINLGSYNDKVFTKINKMISDSFDNLDIYEDTINDMISEMKNNVKIDIGFCVNNFMYLLRAFSKNPLFANYVRTVIRGVESSLKAR